MHTEQINNLIAVLVVSGGAEGLVASILLHRRGGPATEGLEGGGAGVVGHVPRREPQGEVLEGGAATHDGRPLTGAGVDAHLHTALVALVHHTLEEVDVVRGGARPVLHISAYIRI